MEVHYFAYLFSTGIRVGTPLFPATHEHLDLRISGQFQGKRLDRGPSPGLSAGHGGLVRLYPPLLEQCPQLFRRLEAPVFSQQFLPLQDAWPPECARPASLVPPCR